MFQFPAFASNISWITDLQSVGLSHSEIPGLKVICTYPRLIAAYHVLHRLREPRHPPCALIYFLSNWTLYIWLFSELLSLLRVQSSLLKKVAIQRTYGSIYTFSSLLKFTFFVIIMSKIVSFFVSGSYVSVSSKRVENNGFEPLTLCVQGRCSSQLS